MVIKPISVMFGVITFFTYLQSQEGHILDDEDLITTLKQSKVTSAEVGERLKLSEQNEVNTELARSRYMPVATRGAVLYFVVADLEILNPMYQFSLQWFTEKFIECICKSFIHLLPRIFCLEFLFIPMQTT